MAIEDHIADPTPDDFVFCGQRHESTYAHKLVQEGIFMGPETEYTYKMPRPIWLGFESCWRDAGGPELVIKYDPDANPFHIKTKEPVSEEVCKAFELREVL